MIHILLRYLGIKTKMLNHIDEQVDILSKDGETLLDLFAGSNIVGQYFSNKRRIYSNDIQKYSYTVAKATLDINKSFDYKLIDIDKIEESNYFKENYDKMCQLFENAKNQAETDEEIFNIEKLSVHMHFLGLSALYEDRYVNGTEAQRNIYAEQWRWTYDFINAEDMPLTYDNNGMDKPFTLDINPLNQAYPDIGDGER